MSRTERRGAARRGRSPPFGIVLPFRDTPRERRLAEGSVPSALALGPDELVLGIDDGGGADEAARFVGSPYGKRAFAGRLMVVRAARSPGWRFQLANVVRGYCEASGNDSVLVFDVDSVLRRSALCGASMVGRDGTAVVSMAKRTLARGPLEYVRRAPGRLRARAGANAFTGRTGCTSPTTSPTSRGRVSPAYPTALTSTWPLRYGPRACTGSSRCPRWAATRWTCRTHTVAGAVRRRRAARGQRVAAAGRPVRGGPRGGPGRGKGRRVPAATPGARLVVGRVALGLGGLRGRERVEFCRMVDGARVGARQGPARVGAKGAGF